MRLTFFQVDAFAAAPLSGNPAAVIPLETWLDDALLQAIAQENNLSETAFTVPHQADEADYDLRWFTPTAEVALCGHATLAGGHVLIGERDGVRFLTRKSGVLGVARAGEGYALDLPAIRVAPAPHDALLAALGLENAEVFISPDAAEATAIVLVDDEAAVRGCAPDMRALRDIDLMAIVTARGGASGGDIASRVFVPAWGVDEDPVTGSAHAALAPFWAERLGCDTIEAVQVSARGGRMRCRPSGDRVELIGRCVTVIEGTMRL